MAKDVSASEPKRGDLTLGLCFLAALAEGFDIQSAGVAAPTLAPALHLTRDQLGPVFSASIVGLLIGAVLFGRLADRVGRRRTLIVSLTLFGVFSLATAAAWDLSSLLTIRLLAGLGLGGAMPNLVALSAEAVSEQKRARIVTLITAGMPFGAALAGVVAVGADWRVIFAVGGVAPLILAGLMVVALPESARFLSAREVLPGAEPIRLDFPSVLFGPGRAVTTLLLWAASFGALLSLYLLLNWLPTLMGVKGVSKPDASLISVLFNLGTCLGVTILASLLDRKRRSWIIAVWYLGLAGALVGLALSPASLAFSGSAGFLAGVFVGSVSLILYGLAPGFYAVVMRGTGAGSMVAVGRIGAIIGPLLAAGLLAAGAGVEGVLLALLPLVAVAGVSTLGLLGRPTVAD
jgi:AAHS family 3-hydroxyphenylpropionic acid transporter